MDVEQAVAAEENVFSNQKGAVENSAIRASIEYFASFQEVDVHCHYCMSRFDHITHLPITLHCGHSVCEPCLKEVLQKRKCPQCIYDNAENCTALPDPEKTYPYNILLLEVLKYEATSLANQQIKFENLCSSVCNRFLKKFNDIVNSLNSWHEHLKIGEGYLTTLQFYEQELDFAKKMIQSNEEKNILNGRKIAAQACVEIERLAKRFSYEWAQIVNCHKTQSIKGYKLFLFPYYLPTFMTILANNPKICYAVERLKGKDKYYQITGGENRFHLHRECSTPSLDSRPFYFQLSDLMEIINKSKITAFFTMHWTSRETTTCRYHRVYIELRYNFHFGASTLSLFLGDFAGISYKDFSVAVLPGRIFISCNTPYYQSLEVPDEIDKLGLSTADCTARKVVSDWKGRVGTMNILTDDTLYANYDAYDVRSKKRDPPNIYYGEVISGFDFLRNLTGHDDIEIVDCGLCAINN